MDREAKGGLKECPSPVSSTLRTSPVLAEPGDASGRAVTPPDPTEERDRYRDKGESSGAVVAPPHPTLELQCSPSHEPPPWHYLLYSPWHPNCIGCREAKQ